MRCHEVRKHTSEYIDLFLDESSREQVSNHLALCGSCRRHVDATRQAIALLKQSSAPAPPPELFERAILAIERETEPAMTIVTRRHFQLKPKYQGNLLQIAGQIVRDYEFKLVAHCVGLCISFVLFSALLLSMRPILRMSPYFPQNERPIWISRIAGGEGRPGSVTPAAYTLPRITDGNSLVQYAKQSDLLYMGDFVVIAEVTPDGRGSIVQVLSGPPDSQAVGQLAVALNQPRTFVPAHAVSGKAVNSLVVLRFDWIDVWG